MKVSSDGTAKNEIVRFLHCVTCLRERRKPDIEVGLMPNGFQVWCRFHKMEVAKFTDVGHVPIPECLCCAGAEKKNS